MFDDVWVRDLKKLIQAIVFEMMKYPLVICYIAVENQHVRWKNPLFLWPSIAIPLHSLGSPWTYPNRPGGWPLEDCNVVAAGQD